MTPVRLEPTAPRSRVKHSTTEPMRSLHDVSWESIVTWNDYLTAGFDCESVVCGNDTFYS